MVNLFLGAGVLFLTAFISPLKEGRKQIKNIIGHDNLIEVYGSTPLEVCEQRDVKGLCQKARDGVIKNYTGISTPYELPANPDIVLYTVKLTIRESVQVITKYLRAEGYILK